MHRIRTARIVTFTTLALAVAGCSGDSPVGPGPGSSELSAQMLEITLEADGLMEGLLAPQLVAPAASAQTTGVSPATVTTELSFSRTRDCPAGGEMTVEGNLFRSFDRETRTLEAHFEGSRILTDCAFVRGDFTITVNGSAEWEATRRRVKGEPDGPQITRIAGSFTAVRNDGEERSCTFEITITRNPDSLTREMTGMLCGEAFRRVVAWHHDG